MIIGICDADEREHSHLVRLCDDFGNHAYLHYYCGEELLHSDKLPEFLFLNIKLPDVDGIQIMRKLEFFFPSPYIIFYASRIERSIELYGRKVIGFLHRPISKNEIEKYLQHAKRLLSMEGYLALKDHDKVFYNEIRYIESSKNYAVFHTVCENSFLSRITMKKLMGLLPPGFFYIHKSYIVNFYHVARLSNDYFVLDDKENTTLPISRKNKKEIKKEYEDFLFEQRYFQ